MDYNQFLKQMSHELVTGEITRRSIKTVEMPVDLQQRLKRFRPCKDEENEDESSPGPSKRRICAKCTTKTGIRRLSSMNARNARNARKQFVRHMRILSVISATT
jgi:hypothetical protein